MGRWMKESFPRELARLQRMVFEAKQRPSASMPSLR
jgi:hypothetical protein